MDCTLAHNEFDEECYIKGTILQILQTRKIQWVVVKLISFLLLSIKNYQSLSFYLSKPNFNGKQSRIEKIALENPRIWKIAYSDEI